MQDMARKLAALSALVLGAVLAGYEARTLMSDSHAQAVSKSNRVVNLGTILVTPQDAAPPLGRDGARYALRAGPRRANPGEQQHAI